MTAAESRQMTGESPGWRGSVEDSRFVPQECRAVAPPAATNMLFSFLTDGDNVVGCIGIDDIVVSCLGIALCPATGLLLCGIHSRTQGLARLSDFVGRGLHSSDVVGFDGLL
jgi:hypothetical protein